MKTLQDIQKRMNELFQSAEAVLERVKKDSSGMEWVHSPSKANVRASVLSFFEKVFGKDSIYYTDFASQSISQTANHFRDAVGTLLAAKDEIDGGWLFTTKGLISSEIFSDYLDMATHLSEEGYKDAAAVITGSTLEEHLRQLCNRHSIPTEQPKDGKLVPLKADRLNADLAKANIYEKLDQKNVTAWLDLRNKAAHGKYSEYKSDQVKIMIQSIRDFITRNPL